MHKLNLPPDQASYGFGDTDEVISQKLDGGLSRNRVDILNATKVLTCQWTVGSDNYRYLRAFYNVNKAIPFLIDLYMDEPVLTEHEAQFVADSFRLNSQQGLTFVVSCQIEAKPIDNSEADESLVELVDAYGSVYEASQVLNLLEKLVNVDLPTVA